MRIVNNFKEVYQFKKKYNFGDILGVGTYGTVRKATDKACKNDVAIKIINKKRLGKKKCTTIRNEVALLQQCNDPYIVRFHECYESENSFYIVTELATGGELFHRIIEQQSFTEEDAKTVIRQLLSALNYLHANNIVHRDIKPENIVFENDDDNSKIKLVDFGIAKRLDSKNPNCSGYAGTFLYSAPETYQDSYDHKADVWSVGVVCYMLLCGFHPFRSKDVNSFLIEVQKPVVFYEEYWCDISEEAKSFIKTCMDLNKKTRPNTEQLICHPWLAKDDETKTTTTAITTTAKGEVNLINNIKHHLTAEAKLRQAVKLVLLKQKLDELRDLLNEEGVSDDEREVYGVDSDTISNFSAVERRRSSASSITIKPLQELQLSDEEKKSKMLNSTFYNLVLAAKENKHKFELDIPEEKAGDSVKEQTQKLKETV